MTFILYLHFPFTVYLGYTILTEMAEQLMLLAYIFVLSGGTKIDVDMLDKVLNIIPVDIVCLMETWVFPKDRALVNVQKLAFCVPLNAEENIFAT